MQETIKVLNVLKHMPCIITNSAEASDALPSSDEEEQRCTRIVKYILSVFCISARVLSYRNVNLYSASIQGAFSS